MYILNKAKNGVLTIKKKVLVFTINTNTIKNNISIVIIQNVPYNKI